MNERTATETPVPSGQGLIAARLVWVAHRVHRHSLVRNSAYIMATTAVTSVLGYAYWIVAARLYQPHDVGLAAALLSAMMLVSTVASLGIGSSLVQLLPRRRAGAEWSLTLNSAVVLGVTTSTVAAALVIAVLPVLSSELSVLRRDGLYATAFLAGVVLWTISILLDYTFVAERATGNMLTRNLAFSALKVPLLAAPVLITAGALGIFLSWTIATAVTVVLGLALVLRLGRRYRFLVRGSLSHLREVRSSVLLQHATSVAGEVPAYFLPVMVAGLVSVTSNAFFYATWRLGSIFFMVSPAVATSLFAEGSHGPDELRRKARTSLLLIAALLGPLMLVFLIMGRDLLSVFGSSYAEKGAALLTILVLSAIPDAITNVYVSVLRVRGRLRAAALLNVGMAMMALMLALFLLPTVGIIGAGWAWLGSQTAGAAAVGLDLVVARLRRTHRAKNRVETCAYS